MYKNNFSINNSYWPILLTLSIFFLIISLILILSKSNYFLFLSFFGISIVSIIYIIYKWILEVFNEKSFKNIDQKTFKHGMILFLTIELVIFVTTLISNFYIKLNPLKKLDIIANYTNVSLKYKIPDSNFINFNLNEHLDIFDWPLIKILVLMLSSCILTFSFEAFIDKNNFDANDNDDPISLQNNQNTAKYNANCNNEIINLSFLKSLLITIVLGFIFLIIQFFEYFNINCSFTDNFYTANFYYITGLSSLYSIIGIFLLIFGYFKIKSIKQYKQFELICLYWHFINLIWIIIFLFLYVF